MIDLKGINAIIFDFGGVILNLDYMRTIRAFENLGFADFKEWYTQAQQDSVFDEIEVGAISEDDFRTGIKELGKIEISDVQFDNAWNAMLLDLPEERLSLLSSLKEQKRVFLLSNTNVIHARCFKNSIRLEHRGAELQSYFEAAYYSHEMGLRKPNPEIFQKLIERHGLDPTETLFIDDSIQHIEGAKLCGLQVHHLTQGQTIEALFGLQIS